MNKKKETRAKVETTANKLGYATRYTVTRSLYDCLGAIGDKHLTVEQKRMVKRIKAEKNKRDIA